MTMSAMTTPYDKGGIFPAPPTGAWVLWFQGTNGDEIPSDQVEIHGSELDALRAALRNVGEAGAIVHYQPVVTFVPFGKSIADAVLVARGDAS